MAHQVTEKDSGFMFGKPAWHRLFPVLTKRPKGIREMRKAAGLPWDVETVPFITLPQLKALAQAAPNIAAKQLVAQAGEFCAPNHRAIVRDDTLDVLGTWSDEGEPFTNAQGFAFAEALLGELLPEALFSIRGGQQVCILLEFPEHITVGGDVYRRYLYLRLDHSGAGSAQIMLTNVRVQCGNTDRMALNEARARDGIIRIRHIGNLSTQLAEVRTTFDLRVDYDKQFKRFGDRLAKQKLAEKKLAGVVDELWPAGSDGTRAIKNAKARRDLIVGIFRGEGKIGDTRGNMAGSKLGGYNAVTEYMQHYQRVQVPKVLRDADGGLSEAGERVVAERQFVRGTEDPGGLRAKALDLIALA